MTKSIYDQFEAATGVISAHALLLNGEAVGRVIHKNGAACTCYFQIWGAPMVKGQARGGGYDRHSAAVENATAKLGADSITRPTTAEQIVTVKRCIHDREAEGLHWMRRLENAGFTVATVI